ncbi:MAG: carboxylesterase family protein [Alphaproteobacteria bacterium]|nr:carboxylesterase family protein [Alphaproteobacteria bacterium]
MRVALWLLFTLSLTVVTARAEPVAVEGGLIEGANDGGLTAYKGVPFAAPPVGDLRWREPQPVVPWSGVRPAKQFAPACMQRGVSMPGEAPPAISEDCLYVNIWAPAHSSAARLPVLVWIYGGGFSNGSASMPLYWGDKLARKGIVVVTVAYRVGAFGFLAHPELTHESPHATSGNYGLLDQIAALRWVKNNIAAVGGDPTRVTIAGQSAGSTSVCILAASPLARGLFEGVIGESGGFFEPVQIAPGYILANAEREGAAFAQSLGASSIAALRSLPAAKVLEGKMPSGAHPVIDPYVLPATPYDAFATGRQSDVPTLIGANAEEARAFLDVSSIHAATYGADIEKMFGKLPPQLYEQYPHTTDADARQSRIEFETDLRFRWNMWTWARLQSATGKSKVFFYSFDHAPPFPSNSVRAGWGASHFAELWYVFDHLDQEPYRWTQADRRLADAMSSYWVNFVRTGNPNGNGLAQWPEFKTEDGPGLELGDQIGSAAVARTGNLRVFSAIYDQLRGASHP